MARDLLVVRSGARLCAFPVESIEEMLRPLPIESILGGPHYMRGAAVVRGRVTPIVDLRALLGDDVSQDPRRLVVLRTDRTRRVGLLVDEVVRVLDGTSLSRDALPPLFDDTATPIVQELARLDERLMTILRASALVPDEVWACLLSDPADDATDRDAAKREGKP